MVPAVLFDMNGVLIDDEDLHRRAFAEVTAEAGAPLGELDYNEFFAGRTDREGFVSFFAERHSGREFPIDVLLARKAAVYRRLAVSSLRAYDGAIGLVGELDRSGHDLGLVTSSSREDTRLVLNHLQLTDAFRSVVTAEDVGQGKPAPEPYSTCARMLGRAPSDCVVIEDSPSGVASAKSAGMRCVAVASTHRADELNRADAVVGALTDLDLPSIDRLT